MVQFLISLFLIAAIASASLAVIPSMGLHTAASTRSKLTDSEFKLIIKRGITVNTPNFQAKIVDLSKFPALAGVDVQSQIVRAKIKAGKPFITHYHPRSAEVLICLQGMLRVSFTFEGLSPRVVTNEIMVGEATVFPQGLIHSTVCITDKVPCIFVSTFTSADPGLVPVNN